MLPSRVWGWSDKRGWGCDCSEQKQWSQRSHSFSVGSCCGPVGGPTNLVGPQDIDWRGSEGDPLMLRERSMRWGPGAPSCGASGPSLPPSLGMMVTPQSLDLKLVAGWLGVACGSELEKVAWVEMSGTSIPGLDRSSIIKINSGDFSDVSCWLVLGSSLECKILV